MSYIFIFAAQNKFMNNWLWIIPVTSSVCGLAIAIIVRALIFRSVPKMVQDLISSSKEHIPSMSGQAFKNIQPLIESQIDNFLRHKLSKSMPMLSMFIGEKTINQMKSVFMKELEDIFPEVMGKYSDDVLSSAEIKLTPLIISKLKKQLQPLPLAGLVAGLLTGVIQLLVLAAVK